MNYSERLFNRSYENLDGITPSELMQLLTPKSELMITEEKVVEQIESERKLNVKFGTDPTGPDLHLGHIVPIRILDILNRAGHNIDLVFGDFTAKIGDPSGRSSERPLLSDDKIAENVSTFQDQIDKYFNTRSDNVTVSRNSTWLSDMTLSDAFQYMEEVNLSEAMHRRDFKERMLGGKAVSLAEAFYATMMGIDSLRLNTDLEIGGIDQLLNFQQTREVQKKHGEAPECVIMTPILEGTSGGGIKMSKSLGNYVPIKSSSEEIYGKIMSIPDSIIEQYFTSFAPIYSKDVPKLQQEISKDPLRMKKELATYMAAISMKNYNVGLRAREEFDIRFAQNEILEDSIINVPGDNNTSVLDALLSSGEYKSKGELRRLVENGGVRINGKKIDVDALYNKPLEEDDIIMVGKRKVFRFSLEKPE